MNQNKIYCPVCQVSFLQKETMTKGKIIICPVCGAKLELTQIEPEIIAQKVVQQPLDEIIERIEAFAKLRNFTFNEDREDLVAGLLKKKETYGDFYCPCRFENTPENICPCHQTRMGFVQKNGNCY